MLAILSYDTKAELRRLLQTRGDGPWKFVTPFPAKADALRAAWQSRPFTEVLTVSRFTQDLFEARYSDKEEEKPWRKSRLMLQLNAFKNLHPLYKDVDFGTFKTSYQVYSDLRSYTDSPELPDELLAPFDESVQELVKLFHEATRLSGIRDEHAAVFNLTAELRAPEGLQVEGNPLLIFEGFTFITPAQLSFFEALAIRHDVVVPIPRIVMERGHIWDWPQVLKMAAHQVEESAVVDRSTKKWSAYQYPASGLGSALRAWRSPLKGTVQIVLGTKTPAPGAQQEIPFADIFMKREVDVTGEAREALFLAWEERLGQQTKKLGGTLLLDWCAADKLKALAKKDMSAIRTYKAILMVEDALASVPQCLANQPLNVFLLRLLSEVVGLDAPRNSQIPLLKEQATVRLLGLRDVDSISSDLPMALCLDSSLGPVKSDHRPYSPERERELAKLGPVKRPELDFLFLKAELNELLEHPSLTLLIEEGLLKHDLAWKQVFEGRELEQVHWHSQSGPTPKTDYTFFAAPSGKVPLPKSMSASRLQGYLNCPRHYHAQRIEKIIPDVTPVLDIDSMTLGNLEHALVGRAWLKGHTWWNERANLENEVLTLLNEVELRPLLTPVQVAATIAEVSLYAYNGLRALAAIERAIPGTTYRFEVDLRAPGVTGSIDCLGSGGGVTVVIDFKRSKGSNPEFSKWAQFEKIQLWYYLNALQRENLLGEKVVAGYFFFKDFDKSWIAANDGAMQIALKAEFENSAKLIESWPENFRLYQEFEKHTLARLAAEELFAPLPLTSDVCSFCELRTLCPRVAEAAEEA